MSRRVNPDTAKSFLNVFGKPMFLYVYDAAVQSGLHEDVVISTNSQQFLDSCKAHEIDVPFQRPEKLAENDATIASVCQHTLEEMEKEGKRYDNLCLLWTTVVKHYLHMELPRFNVKAAVSTSLTKRTFS